MAGFSFTAIRSIQLKIALIAGLCLVGTVAVLIGYGLYSTSSTHDFVSAEVLRQADSQAKESLLNRAGAEARYIKAALDVSFDAARTMAQTFAVLADDRNSATPVNDRRAQFNAVLRRVLEQNPAFNGTYSAWEPNGLDSNDAAYQDHRDQGSDATGRFLPYWTRAADGTIAIQPLVEYDSHATHPNGLVKGAWYINPSMTGKENILGPLPYIVQGKDVFLATMSVPVMIDGKFRGLAGADYNLDFLQKLADQMNATLYGGKGKVAVLNDTGLLIADSGNPGAVGKAAASINPHWSESTGIVRAGKPVVMDHPDWPNIDVYAPIKLGFTDAPWSVVITVPRDVALAQAHELSASMNARATASSIWQLGFGLIIAVAAIAAITVAAGGIAKPIRRCVAFATGVSNHDLDQTLEIEQADEIGVLAGALRKMLTDLKQAVVQRAADQEKAEAERRQGMRGMADKFEVSVGGIVAGVSSQATELQATAQSMAATAEETSRQSTAVSAASEQAGQSINTVAAATEQLAVSVQEISQQTNRATEMISDAVVRANATNEQVRGLATAASKIGDVVTIINDIASQTNLLALNATIEAARAGDAGKGFAVVASEVKTLANQTAKATQEIAAQVTAIQAATQVSVQGIQGIVETIARVSETSTAVASAVEEQGAATKDIARNVAEAAKGTASVTSNIATVSEAARSSGAAASEVLAPVHALSKSSETLKSQVDDFLRDVRAAESGRGLAQGPHAALPVCTHAPASH
jgi:methyl-accepting chemotaxis protein